MNQTLADLPSPAARLTANLQLTGAGGGHGLRFGTLQILGMNMLGRLARVDNSRAPVRGRPGCFGRVRRRPVGRAAPVAARAVDGTRHDRPGTARTSVVRVHTARGDWPSRRRGRHPDVGIPPGILIDRTDRRRRNEIPPPRRERRSAGLSFCGVHFLRTRRPSLLLGVGADARSSRSRSRRDRADDPRGASRAPVWARAMIRMRDAPSQRPARRSPAGAYPQQL